MSCGQTRETLALHLEGDLSGDAAVAMARHLEICDDCGRFYEQLRRSQALLKSLRRDTVSADECARMRRGVMTSIDDARDGAGWTLRLERAVVLGFRRRSYAFATFALLALVSVAVLTQLGQAAPETRPSAAVFDAGELLRLPAGYRGWVLVSQASRPGGDTGAPASRVYIDPAGYREFLTSGAFAEGTIMVWEAGTDALETSEGPHAAAVLLASVKDDTRFDGGWGYFDFSMADGALRDQAAALPVARGCHACHREEAGTDQVFTQFYPVLYSARQIGPDRAHT